MMRISGHGLNSMTPSTEHGIVQHAGKGEIHGACLYQGRSSVCGHVSQETSPRTTRSDTHNYSWDARRVRRPSIYEFTALIFQGGAVTRYGGGMAGMAFIQVNLTKDSS